MNGKTITAAAAAILVGGAQLAASSADAADVLVYTRWQYVKNQKTGEVAKDGTAPWAKAYHHASTEQGAEEVRRYFTANGLKCLVTDDPSVFTSGAMKKFKAVMLCNCNHELFENAAQREAFYKYVENGGGLVATHSSSACERGDRRFRDFLGGAFERHYRSQPVKFSRTDRTHPAMAMFPEGYVWENDEVYLNHPDEEGLRPLMILDWRDIAPKSRATDKYGCPKIGGHVLEWCKTYGKGRIFYTALGHRPQDWGKMEWQLHLLEATRWAMGELPDKVDAKSSSATARVTIDGAECVKDGKTVWKLNLANRESKPFVHPLCLPDGRCVTDARPKDHPWHLGLWFCWKFINGVNYWEPRSPAARNLFPDGMTVVKDYRIAPKAGGACDVALSLWYGPRAEPGKVLMDEERRVSFSAPDAKGGYRIRSTHRFTARADVTLDARRPVAYGGFSLRMAPLVRGFKAEGTGGSPSPDKNVGAEKGLTAVRYSDPGSGHGIEVKMLAPLETERFYTWSDHCFANPMPIYEKPLVLKAGDAFALDYEVTVF
ncbi:MAG: ThuA domain-containing protein [Kiritimatiellae bacterium]|nr:ThuA domain-containing protein [Kiritimatiellia bacterium]